MTYRKQKEDITMVDVLFLIGLFVIAVVAIWIFH
jgi:hypothetical protein